VSVTWELDGLTRLGPLARGVTAEEVVRCLGAPTGTFRKATVVAPVLRWGTWLHVYLTDDGHLDAVEVFPPAQVLWRGVPMLNVPPQALISQLAQAGLHATGVSEDAIQYLDGAVSLVVLDESDAGPLTDSVMVDWATGGST
jgi:hypothetical protein